MVNTLRLTSVAAVLLAVVVLASVLGPKSLVNLGMRNDANLDRILKDPNVVDRFKTSSAGKNPGGADQTPMLVKQAQDFAKILNPTPAAAPPKPTRTDAGRTGRPMPALPAKFTLVGLSYSAVRPEESFACVRLEDGTFRWARKGDEIGNTIIREIRRSSILCLEGSRESEMMVVMPPNTASLLETAAGANGATPDKSRSSGPATGNRAEKALNRIAGQVSQFRQSMGTGDSNDTAGERAAIMSKLVDEYQAAQAGSQETAKGSVRPEPNESKAAKPAPKGPPYGRPLTSPQPKSN
jgi:hypothetical protein